MKNKSNPTPTDALSAANERLYQLQQEKERVIGMVFHDLQNPLSAVAMSAELLQKTGEGQFSATQQKLLANIRQSAERMSVLIHSLTDLNRIERGEMSENWGSWQLKSLLWDITKRFEVFAMQKNITLHQIAKQTEVDWHVYTERNYLTQIIENLLSNALKFSHHDKRVMVKLVKTDSTCQIIIADEGQGIKMEEMPLLYQRFQPLSALPTDGEPSTGLGLSIVKELTALLKADIQCDSEWGKGTRFTLSLPIVNIYR